MTNLSPLASVRNWYITIFFSLAFLSQAFSQTSTPLNDANAPRHHGIQQNSVAVYFNIDLTGTTTTGQWTITVNNQAVTETGVSSSEFSGWGASASPTGKIVSIQFDASYAGHTEKYILPGDVVRVSFNNSSNTLKTSGSNNNIANFSNLISKNYYTPNATGTAAGTFGSGATGDVLPSSEGPAGVVDQCSPVNTNFYRWTYGYTLRWRNSSKFVLADQKLNVTWNGPPNTTSVIQGFYSDNAGVASTTYTDAFSFGGNPRTLITFRPGYSAATPGTIDVANGGFTYNDNTNICNFRAEIFPSGTTTGAIYNATGQPGIQVSKQFDSYDYDDGNTGALNMNNVVPPANTTTTTDKVCFGTNVGARFVDASTFNCIGVGGALPPSQGAATNPINNQQRWVRLIYGGFTSTSPQGNIRDIVINGDQVTNSTTGALMPAYDNVAHPILPGTYTDMTPNPSPMNQGYVFTGGGADANGVITLAAGANVASVVSELITTSQTINHAVGQRFYVTLQYWNVCNPYPTSSPVEISTDFVEIVTKPVPLTTTGRAMCFGQSTTGVTFSATSSIGAARTGVNWYATRALVGTSTKMNVTANSLTFPVSSYGTKGGVGGAFATNNTNGKYYSVWVTQVAGGTNGCESDPVEVVIFQQPQISNPTALTGEDDVCNGPPPVDESYSTNAAGTKSIATTTSTNPAQINFTLENVWSQTFAAGVSLSSTTGTSIDATYNISPQPSPNTSGDIQVLRRYRTSQAADKIDVVSPLAAPASVPTYQITPLACATGNTTMTVRVWGQSDGGTIAGTKPICDGTTTGTLTVSGHRGKILFWERSFNSTTVWTNIGNANTATFSETLTGVGIYRYRVTVQNQDDILGPCGPATTIAANYAVITVNPVPTKPTITPSGATTFCLGSSVTLTAASTNAATYKWYKDGVATGATSAAIVINAIAANGTYTVEGIGIGTTNCVSPLSDPVVVTVNPLPAGNVAGGGSICSPPPSPAPDIVFTFSAGTGPWDLTYSIDGVNQPVATDVTSPFNITDPVVGVYRIVSITDFNGCTVTAPHANITNTPLQGEVVVGGAPPAFDSAPALVTSAVCSNGGSTPNPEITFNLTDPTATTGADYEISYQVNGATQTPKVFRVNATGGIISVNGAAATTIAFAETAFNNVGTQTLTILAIKSPSNCQTVLNQPYLFTINPLPSGANKTLAAACSPNTISIDIFNTSVATAAGGNNVASTFSWTAVYNGLTGMPASDAGPTATIAGTLTNPTNTVRNAVFTITPTSTATPACPGSTFTITVPVNPKPAIPDQTRTACSGTAFTVPLSNGNPTAATIIPAGTRYTWVVTAHPDVTGESSQGTPQANISQTLTNTTNVSQTVHYVVTPTGGAGVGACVGATFNVDVTVDPKPVIPNQTAAICSGAAFTVAPANGFPTAATIVPAGTTYTWPAPIVTGGVLGGSAASGQASISQTLTNPSTSIQTATYTVTPTSGASGSCVGSNFTVTVTVNPIPVLNTDLTPPDICSGTFNYTPNSFTAGTTYSWSRGTPVGISEAPTSGTGSISDPLTNVTTSPVAVTYTVISSANGCPNAGQDVVVNVNPTPIANPILGPANVCAGTTNPFFYSVTQHPGATYSWEIPVEFSVEAAGGGAIPGGGPGGFTSDYFILLKFNSATPPGGLPVKVIEKSADGCPGTVNTLTIVAATSPPTVAITGPASVCKSQTGVVFSVPQNASSTFTWTVGAGASIVGPAAGTNLYQIIVDFGIAASSTVDVTETNITGCPANYPTKTVTMVTAPVLTPTAQSVCSGSQPSSVVNLDALTSLPSTFSWFVSSIDPNITGAVLNQTGSGPLEHFPPLRNVSGTNGIIKYTVTPTATAAPNCLGVAKEITVTVKPEPVVTAISDQSFCPQVLVNGAVSFPLLSNVAGATMNWTSSNPAIGLVAASGTGDISFTAADNQTGADITSTITVTATANSCTSIGGNSKSFVITIKPRPVVAAVTDITVCPGDPISVPAFTSNTTGGETYAWTNDNASIGLGTSGSGNIAGYFAPANNTGADVVGNISVTGTRLTCTGPATTFRIIIKPQPVVDGVTNKTFCPGDPIAIPLTSNVPGATINWSNSNTSIGLAASGSGDIAGTAPVNNTGADIVGTITVSGIANSCTSAGANVKTFTITIKPTPIVNTVTDIVVCSGANIPATTFSSNIVSAGVTFNWTNSNPAINLGAGGTGNIPAFIAATNAGGTPMVGTISVTGTKNGCSGPAMVFTITVNPEPVVDIVGNQEFCPGDLVSIPLGSNVGGATINWANSNTAIGLVASGTGNISFTAPANNTGANIDGTITVTATDNGCTSTGANSKIFTIRIKPTPIVNAVTDVTVCSGAPVSMIAFTANTGGSEQFTWTNDNIAVGIGLNGTGSIAGYTAPVNVSGVPIVANITVSATKNLCAGPAKTFKITVNPEPVVDVIANKSFCPSEGVNIPLSSNVAGAAISWTNSNTAIGIAASGTGDIVYVAPTNNTGADIVGIITVSASKDGCTSSGANSQTFNITIKPTPIVSTISNITVCSGGMVTVPNFASNIGAGGVTFDWINDNVAIGLVGSGTGNITAFPAASNTTSTSMVATITVTGTKNLCSGPAKTFTITVLPEPVGVSTGIAICSDAAVGVNLSTLITSGAPANKYNITITNAGGLTPMAGSPADGINLNATEIQDDKWRNYTGVPHDIVYHITPISGGSPACTGTTFDFTVTINPEPVVDAVAAQEFCPGDPVNIALLSNVAGATINWSNNNTAIGLVATGSGDIIFAAPANNTGANIDGTITVSATKDGCTSTGANIKTFTIRIKPTPIVNTVADVTVCSGGAVPTIAFTANTGGAETFTWTNDNTGVGLVAGGNGTIVGYTAPVNVSGVPIVANITVSAVRNSCAGPSKTFKITINPEPVVTGIADQNFCPAESINIPFTSNVAGASITWTNSNTLIGIGASGTGDIVFVAPANNTGADITGTITVNASKDGCTSSGGNSQSFQITIKPTPIVNAISNITVCSGGTINVPAFGSNIGSGGVTFNWTNDNTLIGLVANGTGNITAFASAPNITSSPIVATIGVTGVKNLCSGPTRTFTITVLPEPVGTSSDIDICSDAAVGVNLSTLITGGAAANRFNITITNAAGLSASAGAPVDGTNLTATEIQNDKWTNQTGVTHDIVYHLTPISGGSPACSGATFDLTVHVNPEPVVDVIANQVFCPGESINIPLASNVPGANMSWTNTNLAVGLASSGTGDIVYTAPANNTGVAIIATITVSAELDGCTSAGTNKKTFDLTIKPTPIVDAISNVVVCSGAPISTINFTAITGGGESFSWTNDNVGIGIAANGTANIAAFTAPINVSGVPIVANIAVSATRLSCPGPVKNFQIIVNPEPVVATVTNKTFCPGEAVNIPFTSNVAAAAISWTNDNTLIGIGSSGGGDIVYVAPVNNTGADIVGNIVVAASKNGCVSAGANLQTFTITIKPTPIVNAIANVTVCSGGPISAITFGSNIASAGVTFNWTNDNTAVGLLGSGSGDIAAFTAGLNLTSTPMTATVSVTGEKNGCSGPARTFTITVLPQPVGTTTAVTVCSDAAVAVNLNSLISGAAAKYDITITNVAGLPASAGSPANVVGATASEVQDDRWTNWTGTQKDIVYHITPTGPGSPGCVGATFDLTVHVNPEPVVATVLNQEFCPGATVNIPLASNVIGASITWTNTNTVIGIGLSGTGDISFTAPANNTGADIVGTITVNASLNGCQSSGGNTKTFTITIKPTPIVNVIPNVTVCSGAPISTIAFSANTAGGETYAWTNSNTAIGLPANGTTNIPGYTAPVNFTGVPFVATIGVSALRNTCPGPVTNFTITVNPEPVVDAVVPQLFCPGESVNIPLTSNVIGATINWTNSNGTIGIGTSGSGSIVYTAPSNNTGSDIVGTIVVNATKDGCTSAGANSKTFTITIKPTPIVNPVADITVCSGQTVIVPAFGSNVVGGGVTFDWTNDNTGINLPGSDTGDITSFTAATNITGSPMIANITVKGTKNTCSGPLVSFRIIINPEPVVTTVLDKEYCPGSIVNIPLASNVAGALISWTNSNPSIGIGGSGTGDILYTAPTNTTGSDFVATITVTAERNTCISTGANAKSFQITIKAAPVVAPITSINVCSGDMVSAINFTSNADPGVTFDWTNDNPGINLAGGGTGNIAAFAAAVNTGGAPMIANIKVHGTKNLCTGVDATFVITVFPEPVLGTTPNAPICSRGNTSITLATNGTSIGAQTYRLDQIEYSSNGGPFGGAAPAGFTFPGTNKVAGSTGLPDLVKNDVFTNLSPFTVTVRYTITPISASNAASPTGCPGDAAQITIDVDPEPDLDNSLSPSAICSGETIVGGNPGYLLKADAASVAATSFIIHNIFPNGLTPGPLNEVTGTGKADDAINDDSWINTGNAPVDVTYEISPVTGSCVGQKELVVVRVNPSPAVKDGLDRVVCDNTNSGIVLQDNSPTSVAAASYDVISITVGGLAIAPGATVGGLTAAGTNATTGITTDINRIRDDRFVNNTDDRIVVTYTVVPVSAVVLNSCRGPAKVITLMVEPPVKSVSVNTTPTICSGEPVDITFASPTYANGNPTNPLVTFSYATLPSSISGATVGNNLSEGTTITDVLVNTTNAPITVHYRITPRAAAASNGLGCAGVVEDVTVIVEPKPRITPIASKNVCEGVPVNLTLTSTTTPSTGTIKILVTSTADAEITGSSGATGPGVLFANGSMIVDALSNSASVTKFVTYHLLVQNVDATDVPICDAGAPIDVTVGVTPTPVFSPIANFAICSGDSFNPIPINTDTETTTPGSTLITWSVVANASVSGESPGAGNSFSQVLFNNTNDKQAVVYSIKATNISNSPTCAATPMPLTVTVYPNPKAINIPTTINACNNGQLPGNPSVPFTIQASTLPALGTTFDWPVPDNGSDPDMPLVAAGTNATTIPQVFVNNGGSQGTQTYQIKAHLTIPAGDNPIIDVGLGLDNVCEAQVESTMVVRVAPPVGGDIFSYDLSGAESSEVYLCRGATAFNYIAPVGLPNLRMDYEENGVPKTLTGAGQKAIPGNPAVTTTYLLKTVTDAFNCTVTVNKTLVVHVDEVDATSSVVGPDSGCSPFTATFQYNQVTGTNYKWNWADGTEEPIFTAATTQSNKQQQHVFNTLSTSQSVTLHPTLEMTLDPTKFQDGCKKTADFDITLFPTINASVFPNKDAMCSNDVVAFTNGTVGTNLTHRWFYRVQGSTTELEVKHTPVASFQIPNTSTSNPLVYEVVYEVENLTCAAPQVVTPITVYRGVDAHFSHTTPTLFVGGHSTMSFTNDSAPVDGGDFRYEWVFGLDANPGTANSVGPTFNLDYTTPGPKEVRLLVTNIVAEGVSLTCQDEYVEMINIAVPPLVADFKAIPLEACFPTDITVTENNATGDVFEWRVLDAAGTAGQSNANLPVFKIPSPGKYTIELTTRNTFTGDQKTATQDVIVYDLPMASFDFRPGLVYVPDTELLTYNFSDGATTYAWDFGDGSTSDEKEPTHTYKVEGVYEITLIAQNDHGNSIVCVDTLVRKVTAKQGGVTRVPNAFTPSPNGPSTSNGGLPGANSFNDVFLPQVKGAEEFNMQVYDRWGNLVFESISSTVGWDGYDRHGKLMPAGVYVYKLTLRLSDGQRTTQVGDITMIR